jgi:hypothetical protein
LHTARTRGKGSVIRPRTVPPEYVASGMVKELLKIFFCVRRKRVRKSRSLAL